MVLWFVTIAALGIGGVVAHPRVLAAIDPRFALRYLFSGRGTSFLVLGGVFLCVTGAEALYADMGHFGARPIRWAWMGLVFPCLILSYAGQGAIVLAGVPASDNVFFRLSPPLLLVPLVVLATIATIIASQAVITGAFSMTRQAIQLGWMPRLHIAQTSAEGYGQIYVGAINWILMIVTVGLALAFRKSDNLAAAYGIAVSATMLMTSALLFIAMRELWRWDIVRASAVAGAFFVIDASFFAANLLKIADGGYVPLALAAAVYAVMVIWHLGAEAVNARLQESIVPIDQFMGELQNRKIARVPGTAVFLTRTQRDAPPVMVWHVRHNRSLHEKVFVLTTITESIPWVRAEDRMIVAEIAPCFFRATARFGFMERPDIPALLEEAHARGCTIDLSDVTYYVGHETVVAREDEPGLPRWVEHAYAVMQRNAAHVTDYFKLAPDRVVEIGREVSV
jgi:KUP system potassium uptake protein